MFPMASPHNKNVGQDTRNQLCCQQRIMPLILSYSSFDGFGVLFPEVGDCCGFRGGIEEDGTLAIRFITSTKSLLLVSDIY